MSEVKSVKCVIVGDSLVGKTFFLTTVVTGTFPDFCYPTVCDAQSQHVRLRNGREVAMCYWDFCKL